MDLSLDNPRRLICHYITNRGIISNPGSDLVLINKEKIKNLPSSGFAFRANHRVKIKESEKINKFLDLTRELKNKQTVEHGGQGNISCRCARNGPQDLAKGTGEIRNQLKNPSDPD